MSNHGIRWAAVACPAVITALLASMATPAATAAGKGSCPGAAASPGAASRALLANAVVCEINRERASRGLAKVRSHPKLATMAGRYARSMVSQGFFSHVSPAGVSMTERLRKAGYGGARWSAGEALAWGSGSQANPRAIVAAWMNSPPHRAVLLGRNYRDVGIGVALGSPFGRAMDSSATYAAELGRAGA